MVGIPGQRARYTHDTQHTHDTSWLELPQLLQLQLQESGQGQRLRREGGYRCGSSSNSDSGAADDVCPRHGMGIRVSSVRTRRRSAEPLGQMQLAMSHTHTHTHTLITPGPHTNPDITHTRVPCTWGYRSLMHRMLHVAPAGRCLTHSPSQQSTHPHHPRASHTHRYHTHTSLPADDSRRQPCMLLASRRHEPRYVMCR